MATARMRSYRKICVQSGNIVEMCHCYEKSVYVSMTDPFNLVLFLEQGSEDILILDGGKAIISTVSSEGEINKCVLTN